MRVEPKLKEMRVKPKPNLFVLHVDKENKCTYVQNIEKYVNKSSIFNKVALWGSNFITNKFLFFKVFNYSTELEAYSEPCQTSKMNGFARIFIGFLVVDYFRKTLRLKYLPRFWIRLWNSLVVDKPFAERLFFREQLLLKNYV